MSIYTKILSLDTTYVSCFLLGVIFKEVVTFVSLGGLGADYPLSKCLFYMFLAFAALLLVFLPDALSIKEKVALIPQTLSMKETITLIQDELTEMKRRKSVGIDKIK